MNNLNFLSPTFLEKIKVILPVFRIMLLSIIILVLLLIIKDYLYFKNGIYEQKYITGKMKIRTRRHREIGSESEFYVPYWLWQQKKKKFLMCIFKTKLNVEFPYRGHALKRRFDEKSRIPFRCEVYGKKQ